MDKYIRGIKMNLGGILFIVLIIGVIFLAIKGEKKRRQRGDSGFDDMGGDDD
jgi:hypothetical protein